MHVDIKVGLRCNNECAHCIMQPIKHQKEQRDERLDAPLDEVIGLIDKARTDGCSSITLTGGEMTLREDFEEIIRYAMGSNLNITVQTNGRLLSLPEKYIPLREFSGNERLHFVIALHGSSPEKHDRITGKEGSFVETLAGITALKTIAIDVIGKIVISSINRDDVLNTLSLFAGNSIEEVVIAFPHAEEFTHEMVHRIVPRYQSLGPVLESLAAGHVIVPSKIQLETIPYCVLPSTRLWAWNIDLEYTMERVRGDKTTIQMAMDGQEIDWSISRLTGKFKPPSCDRCLLEYLCEGPWREYSTFYGSEELVPIEDPALVDEFIRRI